MRHIQGVALDLFAAKGFDQVTVEDIATAAEVSPSSIYRYFHTKEGLVLHDEYDDTAIESALRAIAEGQGPLEALRSAMHDVLQTEHFRGDEGRTRTRTRLWLETPSVIAATGHVIEDITPQITQVLVASGRYEHGQARVVANALIWGIVAALRNWYEDPQRRPVEHHFDAAFDALGRMT